MFRELTMYETGAVAGGWENENQLPGDGGDGGGGSWTFENNTDVLSWMPNINWSLSDTMVTVTVLDTTDFDIQLFFDYDSDGFFSDWTFSGAGCIFIWHF